MTANEARAIDLAIGEVLFNVNNFPAEVQSRLLGRDMTPLRKKLTESVLAALVSLPVPADTTALIEEARTHVANWGGDYVERGADLVARLATALESQSAEVARLRMAQTEA